MPTSTSTRAGSLTLAREVARRAAREQIARDAIELFAERGYEQVTVEEVCEQAGISRSSFFRYFESKEDLLLQDLSPFVEDVRAALHAAPITEDPWRTMRRALDPLLDYYVASPEDSLRRANIVIATPQLLSLHREKATAWSRELGPELALRLRVPDDGTHPRPAAVVTAALACMDSAFAAWARGGGTIRLDVLLDQAMGIEP